MEDRHFRARAKRLANRYNIYVQTAAQSIGELYAKLAAGRPLGEAASLGRKRQDGRGCRVRPLVRADRGPGRPRVVHFL